MADYFPEYKAMYAGGAWRGLYRYFDNSNWRTVWKDGREQTFPTSLEALKAAKEKLRERLNPKIEIEHIEPDPDPLGIASWRSEKASAAVMERNEAFGPLAIRRGGKSVPVERKRRRIRGIAAE
ncbi:MAG: hypothetical protein AB7O39_03255 [Flavobacteriaceae bacterium]